MSLFSSCSCEKSFRIPGFIHELQFLSSNVASHCHVNWGSDTYFEGKLHCMPIVEVKQGLGLLSYIIAWSQQDVCFTHSERSLAQHSSYLKSNKPQQKKNNTTPAFLTLATWQNETPASSLQQQCCCCCFFLRMPLTASATHNLLGSLISPHLNIYECCWAATFHYQGDCLAWGSQSFHPAHVCLGAVHSIQLQSVFHSAWLPQVWPVL